MQSQSNAAQATNRTNMCHYGLLVTIVLIASSTLNTDHAVSMSIAGPASVHTKLNLFELPMRNVDAAELLEQYGRLMLGSMNQSVNPCENFYNYACGNWAKTAAVPLRARNETLLQAMQLSINELLHNFLENNTAAELLWQTNVTATTAELKAKQFYQSCKQAKRDMALGYAQFMAQTHDRYGQQRAEHNESNESNESIDWIYVNFMSHYEMYPLLPLRVQYNSATRKFDILLSAPHAVLSNKELVNVQNLTRDFKLQPAEQQAQFVHEYEQLCAFERNLTSFAIKRNASEYLPLAEFLRLHQMDKLNWTHYFELAFNGTQSSDWYIINTLDNLQALLHFLQKSDVKLMRSYVKWRVLIKFYYIWKLEANDGTLASACREHTEHYYNYALLPWFIAQAFDSERRADILHLAKHIKATFYELIEQYNWLDEQTKSEAKTKLNAMDIMVGYNDVMQHQALMDELYADVHMTADWFENLQLLEQDRARIRMRSVNKALIPTLMSTRTVNAYYSEFLNLAQITIGMSQWPFYHRKFPPALKYGGIGSIIGHEMAHGFDTHCYQYNYDGKKLNWWTESSLRNFRERYRCLESQYNKYILLGMLTNGTLTLGDNIADNVGTRLAYYAYMRNEGRLDSEKQPIMDINLTNRQLYFLKFAQTWCSGKDNAAKLRKFKTDVHAYEEFRVIGTLSNMPEFSEAFKCQLGTEMNPLKKCIVW